MGKTKYTLSGFKKQLPLMFMVFPAIIAVGVFRYSPLHGWGMAFYNYRPGQPIYSGRPLGISMFQNFFEDMSGSWHVLRNTLGINFLTIVINLSLAIFIAILINEMRLRRIKKLTQTVTFFPFFISWVITYSIFIVFFSADNGMINVMLVQLGILEYGIDFLGDPGWAWPIILISNSWKFTGYNSVIFLSSIGSIDIELYESAQIDGATRLQRITKITVPMLVPTLTVLLILNAGWIFTSNFEQYFLFTNMSNLRGIEVFDMYIYRYGLRLLNFSYATAVGIMKTFASIFMLYLAHLISKRATGRGLF